MDDYYAALLHDPPESPSPESTSDSEDADSNSQPNQEEAVDACNDAVRSSPQVNDAEEILRNLALAIDSSNITKFNIARGYLWEGVKRGLSRKSFSPCNQLSVKFTDDFGNSEGVVDLGGPMREMFTLVIVYLMTESPLFCGSLNNKFISFQSKCLRENEYYFAGMITAMSLVHGGPGLKQLAQLAYEALVMELDETDVKVEDVYDLELQSSLKALLGATTKEEAVQLMNADSNLMTVLDLAGTLQPIRAVGDVKRMVQTTANWFVLTRAQPAIEQFKRGLSALHVLKAVRANIDVFRPVFCYTKEELNAERMESLFTAKLSPAGSSKAITECLVLSRWCDYLIDVEDGEEPLNMADILFFATGCKSIPPLSFDPSIEFLHELEAGGQPSRFPKANTCSNTLRLPVVHKTYDSFKADMTFAIQNGRGFGLA